MKTRPTKAVANPATVNATISAAHKAIAGRLRPTATTLAMMAVIASVPRSSISGIAIAVKPKTTSAANTAPTPR